MTPALATLLLLGSAATSTQEAEVAAPVEAPPAIEATLERARAANARVQDASYTLHRLEWKGGRYLDQQQILVKCRRPDDIYLRWTGEAHQGREVIYRGVGWNDGRLRVNPGRLLPTLDLDPTGGLAMQNSRQPVWMSSIVRTVDTTMRNHDALTADPEMNATYRDLGTRLVHGVPSHCYEADLPKDRYPQLYARQVLVCMSRESGLPTRFKAWDHEDGQLRVVSDYSYQDLRINTGLSDADFDPDNEAYGF